MLRSGAIDVDSLISEEHALSKGVFAMERQERRGIEGVSTAGNHFPYIISHFPLTENRQGAKSRQVRQDSQDLEQAPTNPVVTAIR